MLEQILNHKFEIVAGLLAISEVLGLFPFFKQNSIFGYVVDGLKKIKAQIEPKK